MSETFVSYISHCELMLNLNSAGYKILVLNNNYRFQTYWGMFKVDKFKFKYKFSRVLWPKMFTRFSDIRKYYKISGAEINLFCRDHGNLNSPVPSWEH